MISRAQKKRRLAPTVTGAKGKMPAVECAVDAVEASDEAVAVEDADDQEVAANLLIPEELLAEEERLRKEREAANNAALKDILADPGQGKLSDAQFQRLDALIQRTAAYTGFLLEQMDEDTGDAGEQPVAPAAGGKRKRGGQPQAKAQAAAGQRLQCELRDYQQTGVRWMFSLFQNGLNGILADQMGLGKTVQTIAFLARLWRHGIRGPFMVVGPLSVLANWQAEFARFCPDLPAVLYHGTKKERAALRAARMQPVEPTDPAGFPVVITSFEMVIADIRALQTVQWKLVVVDEGHRLKNFDCKLLRELRTLRSANKLLLTGTPLQNNLAELWSLLNFLMPEIFTSLSTFESWFDFSDAGGGQQDDAAREQRSQMVGKLHALLRPFLLRRVKADVEASLPPKREIVLYAAQSAEQTALTQQLLDRTLVARCCRHAELAQQRGRPAALNNLVMQLRKASNHPDLLTGDASGDYRYPDSATLRAQCGKLALLHRLLLRLKAGGHKVLIFSQMTKMLDILDTYLEQEGMRSVRLDGGRGLADRQQAVADFSGDAGCFAFLLSTRAGGLGINLTAADTVILYDSDWNPHQDLQAMDRAHRIGQTKPVLVLRLATAHSVDGRMLARANSKLALERMVIKQGAFLVGSKAGGAPAPADTLSRSDLLELAGDAVPLREGPQSGVVSDEVLEQLLDRSHMAAGKAAPYPASGVGYEVVQAAGGGGLLSSIQ